MEAMLKRGSGEGIYDVYLDGEKIGYVRRFETHYNLRRYVVVREWRAFSDKTGKVWAQGSYGGGWNTRRDAVAALVEHTIGKPEKVT
jgi:hypothetical protein